VQALIDELFELDSTGAPESEILKKKQRIKYCTQLFGMNKVQSPVAVGASYNKAGKLIRTLNAI
jgi:hypothetical protein